MRPAPRHLEGEGEAERQPGSPSARPLGVHSPFECHQHLETQLHSKHRGVWGRLPFGCRAVNWLINSVCMFYFCLHLCRQAQYLQCMWPVRWARDGAENSAQNEEVTRLSAHTSPMRHAGREAEERQDGKRSERPQVLSTASQRRASRSHCFSDINTRS